MEKVRYMISDASSMVNVESHVLRYWEDELELNIPRNEMGHRYYTQENIKEFQYIKELKEKGYQLKAIKMIVHNGDMEQRLPELTGNEADKPGGVKNHQVYFKNPETLAVAEAKQASDNKLSWQQQKEEQARLRKRENDLKKTEAEIEKLETRDSEIDEEMAQPEVAVNVAECVRLSIEKAEIAEKLEELYAKWEELA